MTKEQEKAIRNMENFAYGKDMACVSASDIKTVLNLIQEQQAEIEKKDKMIDEMIDYIDNECGCIKGFKNCENIEDPHCKDCIKQYFERKVEEC